MVVSSVSCALISEPSAGDTRLVGPFTRGGTPTTRKAGAGAGNRGGKGTPPPPQPEAADGGGGGGGGCGGGQGGWGPQNRPRRDERGNRACRDDGPNPGPRDHRSIA